MCYIPLVKYSTVYEAFRRKRSNLKQHALMTVKRDDNFGPHLDAYLITKCSHILS